MFYVVSLLINDNLLVHNCSSSSHVIWDIVVIVELC